MKAVQAIINGISKALTVVKVVQAILKGLEVTIEELKKLNTDEKV